MSKGKCLQTVLNFYLFWDNTDQTVGHLIYEEDFTFLRENNGQISTSTTELKKMGKTGSTLPEHPRFSPGTNKLRNYLKDVWIVVQTIRSVNIA